MNDWILGETLSLHFPPRRGTLYYVGKAEHGYTAHGLWTDSWETVITEVVLQKIQLGLSKTDKMTWKMEERMLK